jgi:hypothetical protein
VCSEVCGSGEVVRQVENAFSTLFMVFRADCDTVRDFMIRNHGI